MLYNSNVTEQKQAVCGQDEVHTMKQEPIVGACQNVTQNKPAAYKQKEVNVVLEFPKEVDPKAEEEFKCRLKEIYLRKIKFGSMQLEESAVQSTPPVKGELSNQEDKEYE